MITKHTRTQRLLRTISSHLYGKPENHQIEYIVTINHSGIHLEPNTMIFQNRYNRKPDTKVDVIDHLVQYHDLDLDSSKYIQGTYKFCKSVKGVRKWKRVN